MDKERVQFNLARLKKGGENFEIVVDPDAAVSYKSKKSTKIKEVLKSEDVFTDAKKGQLASEEHMKAVFNTTNKLDVAKAIIDEGEIQLSQEYRNKLYEDKKKKIVDIIHKNGIDPSSGLPHPLTRVENAMEEAKVKIDYYKSADDQVQDILGQIKTVLPIRFETRQIEVKIPPAYAGKMYNTVASFGKITRDAWLSDGTWQVVLEMPAGLQNEFFDKLNSMTHGEVSTKVLD